MGTAKKRSGDRLRAGREKASRNIADIARHLKSSKTKSGVIALFAGPSGTGKTLSAEVLAAETGRDIYRVDLASVVSKYIGETEKNLERVLAAAADRNVVLLFDEADALFGRRSGVRDGRDRHANIDVNYLLQKIEAHAGPVIMTANSKKDLDEALLRRVRFAVDFSDAAA